MNNIESISSNITAPQNTLTLHELSSDSAEVNALFLQYLKDGYFYLEIPEECQSGILAAEEFANTFHEAGSKENLEKLNLSGFGNYEELKKTQTKRFISEINDWDLLVEKEVYHPEIINCARIMDQLGINVLKKALNVLNVPHDLWSDVTGQLVDGGGLHHLTFNYYDPVEQAIGMPAHKDFGFITVLFTKTAGLQGKLDGEWVDIPPRKGYFIINFGRCMNNNITGATEVNPIEHKVKKITEKRFSFGIFQDGGMSEILRQYDTNSHTLNNLNKSYANYVAECFAEYKQ